MVKQKKKWIVKIINWKIKEARWLPMFVALSIWALIWMILSAFELFNWNAKVCLFVYVIYFIIMYLLDGKYPYPTFKVMIKEV